MIINHNMNAMNAHRNMMANNVNSGKAMEKLSSGLRINRAGDDAAGLGISEKMRGQIRGLDQASRNAQDGISMIQTAEGALNETHSILQRMKELSTQAANGTNTDVDRASIQDEMNELTSEINRIGNTTEFNTQKILNGGMSGNDSAKITKATGADKTLGALMTTGTVAADTAASKTLGAVVTSGAVTGTNATTGNMVTASGAIGAGTKITINGIDFDASGKTLAGTAADKNVIDNLTATVGGKTYKLSDLADVTAGANTLKIDNKIKGVSGTIAVTADASSKLNVNTAVASNAGTGTQLVVDGNKTFELGGANLVANSADITTLGNLLASDGVTKLSDVVNISLSGGKLQFDSKSTGTSSSITINSTAPDGKLGTVAADYAAATNTTKGTNGSRIVVDNTTFNLGGVKIDATDATTIATSIDSLKNVTSGGIKLGDLVDIKNNGGKLEFTAKSTGKTSSIAFTSSSVDSVLGTTATDTAATVGVTNTVKGSGTTVERAGLEAGKALSSATDISVAANSTFKVAVGTDSDVTVTLNKSTAAAVYNTSNADANVSKSEMERLVKDINAALQDAGLNGKVSASLSKDNKIQFLSETGKDLEIKDGTNTPLVSNLGFTDKATDMGKNQNVQQVVGPGAQGTGYNTSYQIGANKGQTMSMSISDMRAAALGITGNAGQQGFTKTVGVTNGTTDVKQEAALNVMTKEDATKSIEILDKAIATVSGERGKLGAMQNRLEHTIANLGTSSENLTAAESRIRDVDMAKEMMNFSKNNILSQASQAMLAQAKSQPEAVLQLLR